MLGLCLILLALQGGSSEPPSAHGLHPADSLRSPQRPGLASLEADLVELYAQNLPSLVQVRLAAEAPEEGAVPGPASLGQRELVISGVVLAEIPGGSLVVVPGRWSAERAAALAVFDMGGRRYAAHSVRVDAQLGMSLLRIPELLLEPPALGYAESMPVGSTTVMIGNGFGLYGSLSVGFVSGRGRQLGSLSDLLQVTNPVHPGDSGGLVLDRQGRLVALAMSSLGDALRRTAAERGKTVSAAQVATEGIAFAIPIGDVLRAFHDDLGLPAAAPRPILGLQVQEAPLSRELRRAHGLEQRSGLLVVRVEPGLPAEKAGLQAGDLVIGLSGLPVRSFACLFAWQRGAQARCPVRLLRGDQELVLDVEVVRRARENRAAPSGRPGTQASPALIDQGGR